MIVVTFILYVMYVVMHIASDVGLYVTIATIPSVCILVLLRNFPNIDLIIYLACYTTINDLDCVSAENFTRGTIRWKVLVNIGRETRIYILVQITWRSLNHALAYQEAH